jgi:hypothetical protein
MAGVIDSYLDALESHLDVDPALAKRVRAEFADHLAERMEAFSGPDAEEAARQAVARMGPARDIAARFMLDGMSRETQRIWLVMIATFLATFIAMRLRTLWIAPGLDEARLSLAALVAPLVDRWAFVGAIAAALGGYFAVRRLAARAAPDLRQASTVVTIAMAALAGLAASVAAGLTRIALHGDIADAPLVVLIATLGEIGLVAMLLAQIRALNRRTGRARSMLAG